MYSCHVFLACVKGGLNPHRSLDWNHTGISFSSDPPPDPCPSSPSPPQVRGLGGANVLDYTEDRTPVVSLCQEDYINFWGQRVDATFVNVTDADVAVGVGSAPCRGLLAAACHAEAMFSYWCACFLWKSAPPLFLLPLFAIQATRCAFCQQPWLGPLVISRPLPFTF